MKTYVCKGIRYWYSKQYERWVVELDSGFYYEESKQDAIERIDMEEK